MTKSWFSALVKGLTKTGNNLEPSQNPNDYQYEVKLAPKDIGVKFSANIAELSVDFLQAYPEYLQKTEEVPGILNTKTLVARFYNSMRIVNVFNYINGSFVEIIDNYAAKNKKVKAYFKDPLNKKPLPKFRDVIKTRIGYLVGIVENAGKLEFIKFSDLLSEQALNNLDFFVAFSVSLPYFDDLSANLIFGLDESFVDNNLIDLLIWNETTQRIWYFQIKAEQIEKNPIKVNSLINFKDKQNIDELKVTNVSSLIITTAEKKNTNNKKSNFIIGNILVGVDYGFGYDVFKPNKDLKITMTYDKHAIPEPGDYVHLRNWEHIFAEIKGGYHKGSAAALTDWSETIVFKANLSEWQSRIKQKLSESISYSWDLERSFITSRIMFRMPLKYNGPSNLNPTAFIQYAKQKDPNFKSYYDEKIRGSTPTTVIKEYFNIEFINDNPGEFTAYLAEPVWGHDNLYWPITRSLTETFSNEDRWNTLLNNPNPEVFISLRIINQEKINFRLFTGNLIPIFEREIVLRGYKAITSGLFSYRDKDIALINSNLSISSALKYDQSVRKGSEVLNISFIKTDDDEVNFRLEQSVENIQKTGIGSIGKLNEILMPIREDNGNWSLYSFTQEVNGDTNYKNKVQKLANMSPHATINPRVIPLKREIYDIPWVFVVDDNFIGAYNGNKTLVIDSGQIGSSFNTLPINEFMVFREQNAVRFLVDINSKKRMINLRYDGKEFNESNWPYIFKPNNTRQTLKNNFKPSLIYEKHGEFCVPIHSVKVNNNTVSFIGNIDKNTLNSPSGIDTKHTIQFLDNNGNVIDEISDFLQYKHKNDNLQLSLYKTFSWVAFKNKTKNAQWSSNIANLFLDPTIIEQMLITHVRYEVYKSDYILRNQEPQYVGTSIQTHTQKILDQELVIENNEAKLVIDFAVENDPHNETIIRKFQIGDEKTNRFELLDTVPEIITPKSEKGGYVHYELTLGLLKLI